MPCYDRPFRWSWACRVTNPLFRRRSTLVSAEKEKGRKKKENKTGACHGEYGRLTSDRRGSSRSQLEDHILLYRTKSTLVMLCICREHYFGIAEPIVGPWPVPILPTLYPHDNFSVVQTAASFDDLRF